MQALALTRTRPHLHLRGTPASGYMAELRQLAAAAGVADRVHVLEPAAPQEMERLAAQHDLGFVGETGYTHNNRIALSNKQFSYLLAGIPAIASDVPAQRAFARDVEGAVILYQANDSASLAAQVDSVLGDPQRLAAMRMRAFELGQERFNWQVEQLKLIARVRETLVGAGAHAYP